jgi:D-alanyl-D-alanine carboxypeptidase/D-alanyl-D-alanine-endopeptidase (penicillin-binding protein 4)
VRRRGRRNVCIAALVCAAGAVAVAGLALADTGPSASAATNDPPLRTPLFSPRRVPGLIGDLAEEKQRAQADAALQARLGAALAPYPGCVAVNVGGRPVARVNDTTSYAPASTLKLATATVALHLLGPDHRFRTTVVAAGDDLVLVGGGDPLLATPTYIARQHAKPHLRTARFTSMEALADAIVAAGVKHVNGALLVDDSRHETLRFLPDWEASDATDGEIGALGALTVDGGFSDPIARTRAADPAVVAGQRLQAMLVARGVTIAGGVRRGRVSTGAREVAHIDSPPLSAVIAEMLQASDNYTAEDVLREIAVNPAQHQIGTTDLGRRIVEHELEVLLGAPLAGADVHDGSGLSHADRIRCSTVLGIVELSHKPEYAAIAAGLPVAGESGTLALRFAGTPLAGKLHAKTGTLHNVAGLAGTIDSGADPDFAFIANGSFSTAGGYALEDRIAEAVATYPVVTAPPGLVPAPGSG